MQTYYLASLFFTIYLESSPCPLAVCSVICYSHSRTGGVHTYLTRLPLLGTGAIGRTAHLSALQEMTVSFAAVVRTPVTFICLASLFFHLLECLINDLLSHHVCTDSMHHQCNGSHLGWRGRWPSPRGRAQGSRAGARRTGCVGPRPLPRRMRSQQQRVVFPHQLGNWYDLYLYK